MHQKTSTFLSTCRSDLVEKSTAALVAKGFAQEKIIQALPQKTGNVGLDYKR